MSDATEKPSAYVRAMTEIGDASSALLNAIGNSQATQPDDVQVQTLRIAHAVWEKLYAGPPEPRDVPELLAAALAGKPVSSRSWRVLHSAGFKTYGDLVGQSVSVLYSTRGVGEPAIAYIRVYLATFGYKLRHDFAVDDIPLREFAAENLPRVRSKP